jgi:hypothetical protein
MPFAKLTSDEGFDAKKVCGGSGKREAGSLTGVNGDENIVITRTTSSHSIHLGPLYT